jgi:hypothetical protein
MAEHLWLGNHDSWAERPKVPVTIRRPLLDNELDCAELAIVADAVASHNRLAGFVLQGHAT